MEWGAELWGPRDEEYEMLKGAVVEWPSLVFTQYYEVGFTKIRPHRMVNPCGQILGYDANPLYLLTMRQDIPCGKGQVVHFAELAAEASVFKQ